MDFQQTDKLFTEKFSAKQMYSFEQDFADQNLFNRMQSLCQTRHGRRFDRSNVRIEPFSDGSDTHVFTAKLC